MIHSKWPKLSRPLSGWLVLLPSVAIIALILIFTPVSSASNTAAPTLTGVLPQAQTPVCQSCHPQEYEAWKGTPHAQAAGATCESCHGPYKPGHPDKATMQLPMASDTCRTCHKQTFSEWETSRHASKNIECFDCHNAHTQGLRTGSQQTLCAACHSERQTQVAHATHGINGVDCVSCHMAPENTGAKSSGLAQTQGAVRDHNFTVASDVCAKCHESTIHTSNALVSLKAGSNGSSAGGAAQQANGQASQLEQQITSLNSRLNAVRGAAAISMGLALGLGGFAGLLLGVIGSALWQRRNS